MKARILVCVALIVTSTACAGGSRRSLTSQPEADGAKLRQAPHRPLHKGHMDPATGLYIREDDDLVLQTAMPVVLRRTYLSGDSRSRHFGVGGTHSGEWWLHGDGNPRVSWAELILPTTRIRFARISEGTSHRDAVLEHQGTPTEFHGARLSWNGTGWDMRLRDGSSAQFLDCPRRRDVCAILERTDAHGHRIEFVRNESSLLLKMQSEGRSISFDYDEQRRIVHAFDSGGRQVSYSYDNRGRLTRASGGTAQSEPTGPDDRDELVVVRDPARIVKNEFDVSGRLVRQEVRFSEDDAEPYIQTFRYAVNAGVVVRTEIEDNDGTATVWRFAANRYLTSMTYYSDGAAPATFSYGRDPSTNQIVDVMLACRGPQGPIRQSVPVQHYTSDYYEDVIMQRFCVGWK